MKKERLHPKRQRGSARTGALAASFVVTVSAAAGCKKTSSQNISIARDSDGKCRMHMAVSCPPNATCNPPPPMVIDCPANLARPDDPTPITRRPPGKETWLRRPPRIWVSEGKCTYAAEYFCAPPGDKAAGQCTEPPQPASIECSGGGDVGVAVTRKIATFTYKDISGVCHRVAPMDCTTGPYGGECDPPEGEVVACER